MVRIVVATLLACLLTPTLFAQQTNTGKLRIRAPLYKTNKAQTRFSELEQTDPFEVVITLYDGPAGVGASATILHEETLRVSPNSTRISAPADGIVNIPVPVSGAADLVLGANPTNPLPGDLLKRDVWYTTQVTTFGTNGAAGTRYGASPSQPLGLGASSVSPGGWPAVSAQIPAGSGGVLGGGGTFVSGNPTLGLGGRGKTHDPTIGLTSLFDERYVNDNQNEVDGADVVDGSLTGADIAISTIAGLNIAIGTINGVNVAAGTINGVNVAAGTITGVNIADETVTGTDIADGSLTGADIAAGAISGANVAAGTITGVNIADNTITSFDVTDSSLVGIDILNGSITGIDIGDGTLTGADIATSTINGINIAAGAVSGAHIADGSISTIDIGTGAVSGFNITDGSIQGLDIADNTIRGSNITDNTLTGADIVAGTLSGGDISTSSGSVQVHESLGLTSGATSFYALTVGNHASNAGWNAMEIRAPSNANSGFQMLEMEVLGDNIFRFDADGDAFAEKAWNGGGADYADLIEISTGAESVEPGDVLAIDLHNPRAVVKSHEARSRLVAGIYSTQPAVLGWGERDMDLPHPDAQALMDQGIEVEPISIDREDAAVLWNEVPLALVGIVPCKVSAENGPIRPGDLLVTSWTPGHAMRDDMPEPGSILGKALGTLERGTGVIEVLVTLQ